jgi:L,D-peptidoglycan transpeptidase YkuD (ErfK/YbiS/YcfS/YnhG family)
MTDSAEMDTAALDPPSSCLQRVLVSVPLLKEPDLDNDPPIITGSEAVVSYWERPSPGANWKPVFTDIDAVIGSNGVGKGVDDSEQTPLGSFPLGLSFGHYQPGKFTPPLKIDYRVATDTSWWDSSWRYWKYLLERKAVTPAQSTYNQWIESDGIPRRDPAFKAKYTDLPARDVESLAEKDQKEDPPDDNSAYNLAVFVNHNPTNTPGRGCAIFLHCTDDNETTAGCIAIDEDELANIMVRLDPRKKPYLSVYTHHT